MIDIKTLINENGGIYSINPYIFDNKKVFLFHDRDKDINYSFLTDGEVNHIDTWIDKYPNKKDSFLDDCGTVKRYDFTLKDANILLLNKYYNGKFIKDLYINTNFLYRVLNDTLYCVSINEYDNINIKKIKRLL